MAHKQGGGSTKNNRDSKSKRLGFKKSSDQKVRKGQIILRQRGMQYKNGINVGLAKDYTLYSKSNGFIDFSNLPVISIKDYL
jgi:large subunit ribosomal protein L27